MISNFLSQELLNNRYKIQKQLGSNLTLEGGRRTFLAQDLQTQQSVVVKLLIFKNNFRWDDLKLFEREVETLKSLSHPAIPKYIEYFSVDTPGLKGFALVQSYINARPLQEYLTSGRTFNETEVKQLAKSLLSVLDYLHSHQPPVIHRDIKPSNILLVNSSAHHVGDVYLVDFGSVQTANAQDGTMTIVGTYGYMAPEQFTGRVTASSDLYSLGATLIYLVTGIEPADLPLDNLQIQFEENAFVSSTFREWLKLITHPSLNKRFNSVQSALTALESGELTIKKPPLSNINIIKKTNSININIPYLSLSNNTSYAQVYNNLEKDYQKSWGKVFEIILLRGLWLWLIATISCLFAVVMFIGLPAIIIWNVLFFLPEFIRYVLLFLTVGAVMMRLTSPTVFDIKKFYQALIPDKNVKLNHKDIKRINALNLNINQQEIVLSFSYTSTMDIQESCIVFRDSIKNISEITFENKSYQLVESGTDDNGNKQVVEHEIPPSLYLRVANKRYGLNYKLTTPELYWLAEELSYFLDIPITWE